MPQEKDNYIHIGMFIRFRCKHGYVRFDLCWHQWTNWVMLNMMIMMMEIKTMMMMMMSMIISLHLKSLPYHQAMCLVKPCKISIHTVTF